MIEGLEVWSNIGVPDEERAHQQKLQIHAQFPANNFRQAALQDDLTLSIDYFQVSERIKEIAAERPRKLIETLAEELAEKLQTEFSIQKIEIEIRKFILKDAQWVGVKIIRPQEHSFTE